MKLLACWVPLLLTFSLNAQAPATPRAVAIKDEPHHHFVFENEYVRVFRVSIPAHDATLLHQHDVPYVYVSLGPADVINAVQGKPEARIVMTDGQIGYSLGHFAHIARTDAGSTFDNVTIELLKPQGDPRNLCGQIAASTASGPCEKSGTSRYLGNASELLLETAELRLDLEHLDPKTESIMASAGGSLLIVLNNSELQIKLDGKPARTLRGGEVVWLRARSRTGVSNRSEKQSSYLQLYFKDSGDWATP
jgi:hypothetical protein